MSYLAERARRTELVDAVTKTAVRYPHLSAAAIGRMFGAGVSEVHGILHSAQLDRPRRNSGDDFTAESVAADLAAGLSLKAIAQKFSEPEGAVRNLALAKKLIPREMPKEDKPVIQPETQAVEQPAESRLDLSQYSRRRRTDMPTMEQVEAAMAAEPNAREAARSLGIGYSTIQRLARDYGLQKGRGGAQPAPQSLHHPLVCFQPKSIKGTLARVRIHALAGVMLDDCKYDIELVIREVN